MEDRRVGDMLAAAVLQEMTPTEASVTSLGLGLSGCTCPGARVDDGGLANNKTVLHQLADVLACDGYGAGTEEQLHMSLCISSGVYAQQFEKASSHQVTSRHGGRVARQGTETLLLKRRYVHA